MRKFHVVLSIVSVVCGLLAINVTSSAGYSIDITLNGSGGGSVISYNPLGAINCTYPPQTGTCFYTFAPGASLTLMAVPDQNASFGGWGGSCSNCDTIYCPIITDGDKNCTATFTEIPPSLPVLIEGIRPLYYSLIQEAYFDAPDGATILSRDIPFQENLTFNRPVTVRFRGGFNDSFSDQTGYSILKGKLTIKSGTLVVDGVVISAPDPPVPDSQSPSTPANMKAIAVSSGQVNVTWDASSDNVGVTGYEVYRDGRKVGITGASYSDTGLTASTNYCYKVLAYDLAGNKSDQSVQSCTTTQDATPIGLPGVAVKIALDSSGTVLSTTTATSPGGSQLTLYAGTRISLIADGGVISPPVPQDNVYLSLDNAPGTLPPLPDGINTLAQLRIVLTITGTERDAWFWPSSTNGASGQGLKLTVVVDNQNVSDGTLGLLYDVASGTAVRTGSSALTKVGGAVSSAAKITSGAPLPSGSSQMEFNPDHSGSYNVGGSPPGTGSAPTGAFWSSFTVPDPGSVDLGGGIVVADPSRVNAVMIIEESTREILGDCNFGASDTAATGPSGSDGSQFWCARRQNADGSTEIKISSMQSNLPWIHATRVSTINTNLVMWNIINIQPTGGLHGPDGAVYTDPYKQKDFKFAGVKELHFNSSDGNMHFMVEHCLQPFVNAGYTAWSINYTGTTPGFKVEINVNDTQDGRVLMEENVIKKEGIWKVRKNREDTRGNRGTYDYTTRYKGIAKGTMTFASLPGVKVWETNADVTFATDPKYTTKDTYVFTTEDGTVTQTIYTVPVHSGGCYGIPDSFTDTYPIYPGDGYLSIARNVTPIQYRASATITLSTPLKPHTYTECCSYTDPICQDKTMEIGEQEHEWLYTGDSNLTGESDGTLKGTYAFPFGTPFYEWELKPLAK